MDNIKTISSADETQNASTSADFEIKFRRTIRHGTKIQICRAILEDFFTDCSIQGFKYFYERKRHWSERVFWMIMFVIATSLSCYMIHDAYIKWDEKPVIVSLSEKATPVWKIPFPAVTICPEAKISVKTLNITKTFHKFLSKYEQLQLRKRTVFKIPNFRSDQIFSNVSKELMDQLIALTHVCDSQLFKHFGIGHNITQSTLIQDLNNIAIKLNDSLYDCEWHGENKNCTDIFRPILTEDGICFTYNSLNSRDIYKDGVAPDVLSVNGQPNATYWDLEDGYNDTDKLKSMENAYPRRILGTGVRNGFALMLYLNPNDLDYLCQGPVEGFKVVLHSPAEIPLPSKNFFRVPLEQQVLVSVKPNVLRTSDELLNTDPSRKLCYLNHESKLKFFKVYTQHHCELECASNLMATECGCVYFSYPRNKTTPICGAQKLDCVAKIEGKMVEMIFLDSMHDFNSEEQHCRCLPSCNSINYDVEISSAKFDSAKWMRSYDTPYFKTFSNIHFDKDTLGSLTIYLKEKQFITSKRSELYGRTEFAAACGGILGLFIGVTALSFVEIIYYFTLRLVWTLRIYRFGKNKDFSKSLDGTSTTKPY